MIRANSNSGSSIVSPASVRQGVRRRRLIAGALSSVSVMVAGRAALADLNWINQPTTTNWDTVTPNWQPTGGGSATTWDGSTAIFNSAVNQSTQSINVVSNTSNGPILSATGLTFNMNAANASGYTLTSTTAGAIVNGLDVEGNTLNLSNGSSTPIVAVNFSGTVTASNIKQIAVTIGQNQAQPPLVSSANPSEPPQNPDNLTLGGSNGFALNGGGVLVLANPITLSGGVTVNNNSFLVVGAFPLGSAFNSQVEQTVIPTPIFNNNTLTLNSSNFYVNTTNSVFSASNPNQFVGNVTVNGNSTFYLSRGNTLTSSSIKYNNLFVSGGSTFNLQTAGNTGNTTGAISEFNSCTLTGTGTVTFNEVEFTMQSSTGNLTTPVFAASASNITGTSTFVNRNNLPTATNVGGTPSATYSYGTSFEFNSYTDSGQPTNFFSGGYSNLAGGTVEIFSASNSPIVASGNWNLGSPAINYNVSGVAATTYRGVSLNLNSSSGVSGSIPNFSVGGITTGNVVVNPFSQLFFDGAGLLQWGSASQTITISGIGDTTSTSATGNANGALSFSSDTAQTAQNPIENRLESTVMMTGSSVINVGAATANSSSPSAAQLDGNLIGNSSTGLTKVGIGTLIFSGTGNVWGNTLIEAGSIVVNAGSSLGTSNNPSTFGTLTLASTSGNSTNLTLNTNQTVGSLSGSFSATTGTATNTIVLNNGANLNIVQTANGNFSNGAVSTLTSSIAGNGSISLDARSTATLVLGGSSNYSGGTTINAGTLVVTNTAGSATGSGFVNLSGGTLAGNGNISGPVSVTGGTIAPGVSVAGLHVPSTLTLGGLTLNQNSSPTLVTSLSFSLNTPTTSDAIALGSNTLAFNSANAAGSIPISISNLGGLANGTYPLITYSGSGNLPNFNSLAVPASVNGYTFTLTNPLGAVDLVVASTPLTWTNGAGTGAWNTIDANFNSSDGTATSFNTGNSVIFADGALSTAVTVAGTLSPASVTFNNNSSNYTLSGSGVINGSTGLLVAGTGKVTLANGTTGNGFTGPVSVTGGGVLAVAADNELGTGTSVGLTSDGTPSLSALEATASFNTSRGIFLYGTVGGELLIDSGKTLGLTGTILGTGGLTFNGGGTAVIAPATSSVQIAYTGPTTITGNTTLVAGNKSSMAVNTALNISAGSTFNASTFANAVGSITGGGSIVLGSGATLTTGNDNTSTTFSGPITGSGALSKTGIGTLTLSNTGNTFKGGLTDGGGGTIIGSTGNTGGTSTDAGGTLGAGALTISGASTLKLTSSSNVFGPAATQTSGFVLTTGSGGGLLITPPASTITLPIINGSGALQISGGTTITSAGVPNATFQVSNGSSSNISQSGIVTGTNTGLITLGNNLDGGDTLIVTAVQGNAVYNSSNVTANYHNFSFTSAAASSGYSTGGIGTGTAGITVNSGSTLWFNGSANQLNVGVNVTTNNATGVTTTSLSGGSGNGTLLLNDGSTWKISGKVLYNGGSNTVVDGATVTINVPNTTDVLMDDSAWRAAAPSTGPDQGTSASTVNIIGGGLVDFASGAITTTTYNGTFNINMNPTGIVLAGQLPSGGGETLNAFGYSATSSSGAGSPINISGGTVAFGADQTNPTDTTTLGVNSFRSPLTVLGNASIASSGFEYNSSYGTSNFATGTFNTNAPVTANYAGDLKLANGVTLTVDTFDPVSGASPRSLNFETDGSSGSGIINWGNNSTILIATGNNSGGSVNFGRVLPSGSNSTLNIVHVGSGATLQISSGSTVNIGAIPGKTGVTIGSGFDPLYDATSGNAVSVIDSGNIVWAGRTALDSNLGTIKPYQAGLLSINSSATASLASNTVNISSGVVTHNNRSVLDVTGLSISATGKLDLANNDLVIQNPDAPTAATTLAAITTQLKAGYAGGTWQGSNGIVSTTAASNPTHLTALGVLLNDNGSGSPLIGSFDNISGNDSNGGDTDVLVKYTYYGDADLSGVVDSADYTRIDVGFLNQLTGWQNGDFNYDNIVNGSDYTLIDNAFNTQGATLAAQVATQIAGGVATAVPEPASITLLGLAGIGLLGRRRNRR